MENDERKVKYEVKNIKGTDHDDDTVADIIQHNDEPNIELEQDYSEYPETGTTGSCTNKDTTPTNTVKTQSKHKNHFNNRTIFYHSM